MKSATSMIEFDVSIKSISKARMLKPSRKKGRVYKSESKIVATIYLRTKIVI